MRKSLSFVSLRDRLRLDHNNMYFPQRGDGLRCNNYVPLTAFPVSKMSPGLKRKAAIATTQNVRIVRGDNSLS